MFAVYQNPALSAVLYILSLFSFSVIALIISLCRDNTDAANIGFGFVSNDIAWVCSKVIVSMASLVSLAAFFALVRALSQWRRRNLRDVFVVSPSNGSKELKRLIDRQLGLLGLRSKLEMDS